MFEIIRTIELFAHQRFIFISIFFGILGTCVHLAPDLNESDFFFLLTDFGMYTERNLRQLLRSL